MPLNLTPIKNAIEDVATLEVATLTNPNNAQIDLAASTTNGDIFTAIRANLNQSKLVAYTKFELDGDAVNFINSNEELVPLVEKHAALVSSALETRKTLFESVYQAVKNLIS